MRPAALLLLIVALLAPLPAHAHLTPNSEVALDFAPDRVTASVVIPLGEFEYALRHKLVLDDRGQPRRAEARLARWLGARIAATAPDGRRWRVAIRDVRIGYDAGPPDLRFTADLVPPPGASARAFTLDYAPVLESVTNHIALVFVRHDFGGGQVSTDPALIGGLRAGATRLAVDRGAASGRKGFAAAIGLGMHHIAEGHDHLLFLITLLLPAPLSVAGRRWNGYAGLRKTLRTLIGVVTAFTIGHSVTLIGGAFFGWQLPPAPVESLIALSIFVSALHGFRPLFPRREMLVAGGFGLVHGLAFATLIGNHGLDPWEKAASILGFNLGIEAIQLVVVAATIPALALLAQTRWYRMVRVSGAAIAAVAALAWLAERVSGTQNPLARGIDSALAYAPWLIAALTVLGLTLFLSARKSAAPDIQ